MEAKITQKNLQRNIYNNWSFWENEIIKNNNLWEGYFDNKAITTKSKIIYTGILDLNKNILQCGWAVYPCIYSLLGFIQYIYIPSSFFIWFDNKCDTSLKPLTKKFLDLNDSNVNFDSVNSMKETYDFLNQLWNIDPDTLSLELNTFCDRFNDTWNNEPNQKLLIKVFNTPHDTYNFIKNSMTWDSKELVKENISIALDTIKFACDNAIEEPLLNKRFIDILNTNAPILL